MKKLVFLFCSLLFCITLQAQGKNDAIINTWEYKAPDAPYGYQEGRFVIKEADGKLTGEIKNQQGTITIKDIQKADGKYTCSFYAEGQAIDVTMKVKNKNELEGQAIGGGMDIPFTGKPAKK